MTRRTRPWALAAGLLLAATAGEMNAGAIVCDGVIGNSGEAGESLVRFAPKVARGMGAACDRLGSLWDRAGVGRLNRYAPDGRLLASYPLPQAAGGHDKLALVGDTLVLLVADRLYRLDIASPAGTNPTPLDARAAKMSFGSHTGRLAIADRQGQISLLDPNTGQANPLEAGPLKDLRQLEMTPDGAICAFVGRGQLVRIGDGRVVTGQPARRSPGERPQFLAGSWFGHAWHGTIKRFNADLQPDPGVVLGGASGSFIGHLPQNSELLNGRGLAHLGRGLYAVSGIEGVMHLLQWQTGTRRMRIVRRIGALPRVTGLGLDRAGRIWAVAGCWHWADKPDTPMRLGVNPPEAPGIGQAVMLDSDAFVAPGRLWGQPTFYNGPFDKEVRGDRLGGKCDLPKNPTGSAVYRADGKLVLLVIDPTGRGAAFRIGADGRFQANHGPVTLETALPIRQFTSLAMKNADTLLAAGDGRVIELARDQANWKETRRWGHWGPAAAERFGNEIHIAADAGRLWVADTARHRVLCFDLATNKPLATFGHCDQPGTTLTALHHPRTLAARARRAALHDTTNQRLLKLRLP